MFGGGTRTFYFAALTSTFYEFIKYGLNFVILRLHCVGYVVFLKGEMLIESESAARGPIFGMGAATSFRFIQFLHHLKYQATSP